jgi:hypothetical protein
MKTALWIIIIVLISLLIIQKECHRCPVAEPCPEPDTIQTIKIVKGDSVPHELPAVKVPDPDSIKPQPVPAGIDSASVATAYFSKVYGYTVMVDDSSMYVGFKYLIEQNRLKWVIPNVQNRKPTAIIHNTTLIESVKKRNKYFAGVAVGRSFKSFGLAPSVAILTKKDHLYSVHYDVINKDLYFTVYYKIGK